MNKPPVSTTAMANGKPFLTNGMVEVHIVESWESPDHWNETKGNVTRTIHAYSNAPIIELFVNGKSQGKQTVVPMVEGDQGTYAEWLQVPWEPGILTAFAQSMDGAELARTTKETTNDVDNSDNSSGGVSLVLSLDCPSPHTGTGDALFLDGQDAALVRATLVDSASGSSSSSSSSSSNTLHFATNNVTFRIVSGPGYIQGTANGDPKSYQSHTSTSQTAYHGLVRAVVRVNSLAGLSSHEKILLRYMEVDNSYDNDNKAEDNGAGCGSSPVSSSSSRSRSRSRSSSSLLSCNDDDNDILIEATSPGLAPAQLFIPTSTNRDTASVLAVAAKGAGRPVDFFGTKKST